jgi:hypothetical protein
MGMRGVFTPTGPKGGSLSGGVARRQWWRRGLSSQSVKGDEAGAVLILALAFIIVVSVTVLTLTSWSTNDLNNTTKFSSVATLHSAVTSATNVAIQSIRYHPVPSTTPPSGVATGLLECWVPLSGTVSQLAIDSLTVTLWCNTTETLNSPTTRVVTVEACVGAGSMVSSCAPDLTAVVDINDYPTGGLPGLTQQCNYYTPNPPCGDGITVASWTWD